MNKTTDFYGMIGRVSVAFATLEFAVDQIVEIMIDLSPSPVAKCVSEQWHLERKIRLLKDVASFRLSQDLDIYDALLSILNRIDQLRPFRNDLIHGQWVIDPTHFAKDKADCVNSAWKIKREGKNFHWTHAKITTYPFPYLREKEQEIKTCTDDLFRITETVSKMELVTFEGKRRPTTPSTVRKTRGGAFAGEG